MGFDTIEINLVVNIIFGHNGFFNNSKQIWVTFIRLLGLLSQQDQNKGSLIMVRKILFIWNPTAARIDLRLCWLGTYELGLGTEPNMTSSFF